MAVEAVETMPGGLHRCEAEVEPRHRYCVYGFVILSDAPLALPKYSDGSLGQVECRIAPASFFVTLMGGIDLDPRSDPWYQYAFLPDGSTYVRWNTVGEFLVAQDGHRIMCRRFEESSWESFQVYMLGQALSFALVKQRFEPLHATVVVVDNEAVAFLGDNQFGKSTLAACCLQAGYRLLTDDLLILHQSSDRILAYPGPPRIKLFRKIASRLLGSAASGVPMNAETEKLILATSEEQSCSIPVPLRIIYSLTAPRQVFRKQRPSIERLSPREAFLELVKGTFNRRLVRPQRLERQFGIMARLATHVVVRRLAYPRTLDQLEEIREMVLSDLARDDRRGSGSA